MPDNMQTVDPAQKAFIDMLTGMTTMSLSVTKLSAICQALGKTMEVLIAKIEDMTAAQDDMRAAVEDLSEVQAEGSGYMGSMLQILDDISEKGKDGDPVTWGQVNVAIAKLKSANEEADEEEEEENG